jgi:membrane-bound lytic murein transglycosylase D
MRFFAVALIFFGAAASYAQAPQVPHKMHFANMTLAIRDDARREIQTDVDALTKHGRYFQMKVERAKTYFPIISKIFAEEDLPDDFKYLVLQESALVPDAVSVSNAVGFWQFKDFTALSMGLRVDKEVDERMNIASASRGAANYLKQNNVQFDNWLLAMQAYQMGAGGLKRLIGDRHNGKRHMDITSDSYWYIKKFIAHKVAFESAIEGEPQLKVVLFQSKKARSLSDLAKEVQVEEQTLQEYNKWALKGKIPDDKSYGIIIPTGNTMADFSSLTLTSEKSSKAKPLSAKANTVRPEIKFINGLRAVKAMPSESLVALTNRAGITLSRFLKFNEMPIDQSLDGGAYYFLEKKKTKGEAMQHKVRAGEDLWSIAQAYGLKVGKLEKWNKLARHEKLSIGTFIALNSKVRISPPQVEPKQIEITPPTPTVIAPSLPTEEIPTITAQTQPSEDEFNWEVRPAEGAVATSIAEPIVEKEIATDSLKVKIESQPFELAEHTVQQGETLYAIAKMYQVGVTDLMAWNNLAATSSLKLGQKIVLKTLKEEETVHPTQTVARISANNEQQFHEVKESDTLYGIARQYGVTIKDLMDWNEKKELTIKKGEKLKVVKK